MFRIRRHAIEGNDNAPVETVNVVEYRKGCATSALMERTQDHGLSFTFIFGRA